MGIVVFAQELSVFGLCPSKFTRPLSRAEVKIGLYALLGLVFVVTGIIPLKREEKTLLNSIVLISVACGGSLIVLSLLYLLNWSRMSKFDKQLNPGDLRMGAWKGRIGRDHASSQGGKQGNKDEDVYVAM